VAHAAVLCPSFFRADVIANPTAWDRFQASFRRTIIGFLQARMDRRLAGLTS
jgi:indolepyruvate ferredoxin oxidoreductase alpha subunit